MRSSTTARTACINIPELPLQVLLNRYPDWRAKPTAVVTTDNPLGRITHINKAAYDSGVRKGMRYATALTIQPLLRADIVENTHLQDFDRKLRAILKCFSPIYERCSLASGVYWLDAGGIEHIYDSEYSWARSLVEAIRSTGYSTRCVLGFTRRATFTIALAERGITVFPDEKKELAFLSDLPLNVIPLDELMVLRLKHLAIDTIGSFLDLPGADVRARFGEAAFIIHRFLSTHDSVPLQSEKNDVVLRAAKRFDESIGDVDMLLQALDPGLDRIISDARSNGVWLSRLYLELFDERQHERSEEIVPTEPTRSKMLFLKLLRLRLESFRLESPVSGFTMSARPVAGTPAQGLLISSRSTRDLKKGAEAFTLIRAELGNEAVQIARIRKRHRPEQRIEWEPLLTPAILDKKTISSSDSVRRVICRRFFRELQPLHQTGSREVIAGPYKMSGAWWEESENEEREYRYISGSDTSIYWSFKNTSLNKEYIHGWIA